MKEATHEITACYFPAKGEVDLTWEDLESHKHAELTAKVTPEQGKAISNVVWPCVYSDAVVKKNSEIWKQLATDALLVLQAFSVGHSTQVAIEQALAEDGS